MGISRRNIVIGGAASIAAGVVGAQEATRYLTGDDAARGPAERVAARSAGVGRAQARPARLIGDGSTSDTGAQPQPLPLKPERLAPGERPPQFVVFSWDGAGEDDKKLFSHFRQVAQETKATMTFFLSGIYMLPRSQRMLYAPPGKPLGASAIGYLDDDHVKATIQQTGAAWLEGHDIGTHFNGHFCDSRGVGTWSPQQWRSEIDQAVDFVHTWRTNTGFHDVEALPFDYSKELVGGRTPCLLGQDQLLPTIRELGWRYDASNPGGLQIWPAKRQGIWDFPLQSIPLVGTKYTALSMDYNIMYNQIGPDPDAGSALKRPFWTKQATDSYMAGFHRAYTTNRAPFFIGNHFEDWNGGIYMTAVESALRQIAAYPDVRLVSFRQLADWLDVQDPTVLKKLRFLDPGVAPQDWRDYTTPAPPGKAASEAPAATA
ncbi:hypothetical protein KDL01_06800 [Actinospica durhamensis]|uniref:Lipoprotein n=1 Tax=Actinospica durhamensis TaxID=1508375 RepID=A0A941IQI6_9ACTN|nr:hypothetical protein [Actinospica durhamensis]MBR7832963.1 hypothetical protein [Actinospica durhamensis]